MADFDEEYRESVVDFLQECHDNDFELDKDDIVHILAQDFDYVRKQYQLTKGGKMQ